MDWFSLCMEGFGLAGQSVIHISFVSRLTGKKRKAWHSAVYCLLLCVLNWASIRLAVPDGLAVGAETAVLYGTSRFWLGNPRPLSWTAAIFAVYISQLSFGIINSAEAVLFPRLVGRPLLYLLVALAMLAAFGICVCCYAAVLKFVPLAEDARYVEVLLLPGLFFFAAELYILHTSYRVLPAEPSLEEAGKHGALLVLQVLGLAALLCTLYAYRHLLRGLQDRDALRSLSQAAQVQKIYIDEARARYEQTKSFRHDVRSHLSVLDGLLQSRKLEEGRAYLRKLEVNASALSLTCRTGNPVVDILLGEKLGLAEAGGIAAEVSAILPRPCGVDDLDLCVIFANALDNAIQACQAADGPKLIRIRGERQGDFYRLAFENTCADGPLPPAGTGLANIRSAAEKYHGAMLAEKTGSWFSLNVLLNISLPPDGISGQSS